MRRSAFRMKHTPHIFGLVVLGGLIVGVGAGQRIDGAGYGPEALVVCGLLALLALLRYLWLGYALQAPIHRLTDAAGRVAAGDLGVWLPQRCPAELAPLAVAFRRMVRRLRTTTMSRDALDRILGSINGGLLVVGTDGRVRTANPTVCAFVGRAAEDIVGHPLDDLIEGGVAAIERRLAGTDSGALELELNGPDEARVPVLLSLARIPGRDEVVCVAQEIRAQRDVEAQMQRINVQLWLLNHVTTIALRTRELAPAMNQIADALHASGSFSVVAFALRDRDAELLRVHAAAGLDPSLVGTVEPQAGSRSLLWQVARQGEPIILHMGGSQLDYGDPLIGALRAGILGLFPMRVEGEVIGVTVLAEERLLHTAEDFGRSGMDLAQHVAALVDQKLASEALRRSNHELELARLAAEDANRAKSEFLANMSHEIRTPMTAILGYADLVRDEGRDERETADFVRTIRRNGEHLMSIVNDILDLSKIEAGKVAVERVVCTPVRIAQQVAEMLRRRAEDRGIRLGVRLEWPLPVTIESDPTRLRQILVNLVGNAVKFTEQGSVELVVRRHPQRARSLVFDVVDTGIGMSAPELARLFKPFSQGDTSHSRRFGGTGLGLAISQRLAALLGGSISVHSRKGHGSTFSLEIDGGAMAGEGGVDSLEALDREDPPTPQSARQGPRRRLEARVLLAEDGADNRRLIEHLLTKAGADVTVVEDGRAAVDTIFADGADPLRFDVVLMDMQMPVLDGYAATRELRARGFARPVVALTAHAMEGDAERCTEAGCDAFLTKPIDRADLIAAVADLAGASRGESVPRPG